MTRDLDQTKRRSRHFGENCRGAGVGRLFENQIVAVGVERTAGELQGDVVVAPQ